MRHLGDSTSSQSLKNLTIFNSAQMCLFTPTRETTVPNFRKSCQVIFKLHPYQKLKFDRYFYFWEGYSSNTTWPIFLKYSIVVSAWIWTKYEVGRPKKCKKWLIIFMTWNHPFCRLWIKQILYNLELIFLGCMYSFRSSVHSDGNTKTLRLGITTRYLVK